MVIYTTHIENVKNNQQKIHKEIKNSLSIKMIYMDNDIYSRQNKSSLSI